MGPLRATREQAVLGGRAPPWSWGLGGLRLPPLSPPRSRGLGGLRLPPLSPPEEQRCALERTAPGRGGLT